MMTKSGLDFSVVVVVVVIKVGKLVLSLSWSAIVIIYES